MGVVDTSKWSSSAAAAANGGSAGGLQNNASSGMLNANMPGAGGVPGSFNQSNAGFQSPPNQLQSALPQNMSLLQQAAAGAKLNGAMLNVTSPNSEWPLNSNIFNSNRVSISLILFALF